MYILKVYSVHFTLRSNTNVKKVLSDKLNGTKNALFFFLRELRLISFTFNLQFLYELKRKVRLFKTVCGIFHVRFRSIFIKVYDFVQQNA